MNFKARAVINITGFFDADLALDDLEGELWAQLSESGACFDHGGVSSVSMDVESVVVDEGDPWVAWAANVRAALKAVPEDAHIINNGKTLFAVSPDYDDDASYARVGDPGVFAKLST